MTFTNPVDSPDFVGGPGLGGGIVDHQVALIVPHNDVVLSPFTYVGNATNLIWQMKLPVSPPLGYINFEFWDNSGTAQISDAIYPFASPNNGCRMTDNILIAGPLFRYAIFNSSVTQMTVTELIVTMVLGGAGRLPTTFSPILLDLPATAIPAATTISFYPNTLIPGPATWWIFANATGGIYFLLEWVDTVGSYHGFAQMDLIGVPSSNKIVDVNLPSGFWRLSVNNTTAAAVTVVGSIVTGRV